MSAPNPVPPYRPERPRSIFGPLVLIAIGVLFLLITTGILARHSAWLWFAHYWPVILIAWGLIKLAEYAWARQKGYPPPRLGAGSIVFVIFFILFGATTTRLAGINWEGIRSEIRNDSNVDVFDFMGSGYDFTDTLAQPLQAATQIKVLCDRGDISVTPSTDNQAHLIVHKTLRGDSQDDANRLDGSTKPKFQQQGGLWILDLTGGSYQRGRFNLDLQLPGNAALSVATHSGNISVSGAKGALDASTDHGNVSAEQVAGDASLRLRHGNLTARKIAGNVTVDGGSDSTISDIGGTLTMTGSFAGGVQMSHVAKQVHFSTPRTELQFARLDGDLNMEMDSMHANGLSGPFKLETKSKSVHLEDLSGDVHINDRNASVEMRTKGPMGNIDVSNVHGEIDLTVPANAGFQLDAQSIGGEIQSDFSVSVNNQGNNAIARGTIGKGGPDVRLKADHGTIQIKKQ